MKNPDTTSFSAGLASWNNSVTSLSLVDWTEQLRILSDVADLITPDLSVEEITALIYSNVNHLIDAFQFAVGIYHEQEGIISYKGMIEDGKRVPDFAVQALAENRFASWCVRHGKEMFMNDLDIDYAEYLEHKPVPLAGCDPKAAIYVPLVLDHKVVGLIMVRTIRKNVYQQHHLYILKTVGSFIIRALAFGKISAGAMAQMNGTQKVWSWSREEKLSLRSKRMLELLTAREREVLLQMVTGMPNKTIAEKLNVSATTIKSHTLNIYQKMEVPNRTSAILKAMEWGWFL